MAIFAEWQRTDLSYSQRITDLRTGKGLSSPYRLVLGSTVSNNGGADTLTGGAGLDWFFANQGPHGVIDTITDLNNGGSEQVN
jgi:Ca2+-binding RTX toxin-like protein